MRKEPQVRVLMHQFAIEKTYLVVSGLILNVLISKLPLFSRQLLTSKVSSASFKTSSNLLISIYQFIAKKISVGKLT